MVKQKNQANEGKKEKKNYINNFIYNQKIFVE
jgi:hypothetical protein